MRTLSVTIEDEVDEVLDALSAQTGRDKADLAGDALRRYAQAEAALRVPGEPQYDRKARPIEDRLAEMARDVPQEEWSKVPADLTDQLGHYLYGAPRR